MSNKIALLLFATSLLLTSFAVMTIPQASALTKSTFTDRNVYTTSSHGDSVICGDHKCAHGEKTNWVNAISQSQKVSYGKVGSAHYGEDVMDKLAGSTPEPTTPKGNK